jgi:hypothetical protein
MKKINYIYIVSVMFLLTLLANAGSSLAWPNQVGEMLSSNRAVGGGYISAYREDYLNNPNTVRKYYSTHDWLAESALGLLNNVRTHSFLTKLWNINDPDNLRFWYLFGTELPDAWRINTEFRTACGERFSRANFTLSGHNFLNFSGGNLYNDAAAQIAQMDIFIRIKKAFVEKDCQLAALYMGLLMHIVADATYYGHVTPGASLHNTFYAHMNYVTYKTWTDVNGDRSNEFFNINEAVGKVTLANLKSYITPYLAVVMAGSDTFFGGSGFKSADWLLQNKPSNANHMFWDQVDPSVVWHPTKPDYSQEVSWTHANRPTNGPVTGPAAYFNTLEHNLNTAIYYCATTLNYILDNVDYTDCGCSGQNPPPEQQPYPPEKDAVKDSVKDGVKNALDEFQGLLFFNLIGLTSSVLALTLSSKLLKVIEKMIPVY